MNKTRILAPLVALSLGLAACGGGGSGKKLSKTDLDSKANAICTKAEKDAKAVPQPTSIADAGDAAKYFDKIAPITDKETSDLKALKPASDVKSDWDAFIAQQVKANSLLQTVKDKADKKDASGLKDLGKVANIGDEVSKAASKVGATKCG